ncbi:hypothetical protein KC19_6G007100 [Ceratodon purpureus]|uniref:Uncharacterized protein n=1 Tax=Ceratodon purpureus TaxID=3225 RepID=A0A8T0H8K4_CERPU|nr:hypothetical protein KC19_6G007100 [Ceratodon purpureus]
MISEMQLQKCELIDQSYAASSTASRCSTAPLPVLGLVMRVKLATAIDHTRTTRRSIHGVPSNILLTFNSKANSTQRGIKDAETTSSGAAWAPSIHLLTSLPAKSAIVEPLRASCEAKWDATINVTWQCRKASWIK